MTEQEFNELAGRIEGVAQALLRLAGLLEEANIIDGSLLSALWRGAVPPHDADSALRRSARRTLLDLEHSLMQARGHRVGGRTFAEKPGSWANPAGPFEHGLSCDKMTKVLSERGQTWASNPA